MAEVVTSDEEIYLTYMRLLTIPGIGPVNAINTIANTQNFTAFETARQYAKYVGVAPSEHSSGRKDDRDVQRKTLNAVKFKFIRQMFSVANQHKNFVVMQQRQAQAGIHSTEERVN